MLGSRRRQTRFRHPPPYGEAAVAAPPAAPAQLLARDESVLLGRRLAWPKANVQLIAAECCTLPIIRDVLRSLSVAGFNRN